MSGSSLEYVIFLHFLIFAFMAVTDLGFTLPGTPIVCIIQLCLNRPISVAAAFRLQP